MELGTGMVPISGLPEPFQRLGIVLRDTQTLKIHQAEAELGKGMAALCGPLQPLCRPNIVLLDIEDTLAKFLILPKGTPVIVCAKKPLVLGLQFVSGTLARE